MNLQLKGISVVTFASFAIAVAITIIMQTLSYPLRTTEQKK